MTQGRARRQADGRRRRQAGREQRASAPAMMYIAMLKGWIYQARQIGALGPALLGPVDQMRDGDQQAKRAPREQEYTGEQEDQRGAIEGSAIVRRALLNRALKSCARWRAREEAKAAMQGAPVGGVRQGGRRRARPRRAGTRCRPKRVVTSALAPFGPAIEQSVCGTTGRADRWSMRIQPLAYHVSAQAPNQCACATHAAYCDARRPCSHIGFSSSVSTFLRGQAKPQTGTRPTLLSANGSAGTPANRAPVIAAPVRRDPSSRSPSSPSPSWPSPSWHVPRQRTRAGPKQRAAA